jgi:hypothetical protein
MKVEIPDGLQAAAPQTIWGKILTATPVVMAVIATMLAGLSSSEMTRAQYARSLAAQQQSKAGDQWGFFQAKRLRGAMQRSTLDLLQTNAEVHALDAAALKTYLEERLAAGTPDEKTRVLAVLESAIGKETLAALETAKLPDAGAAPDLNPRIKAALAAVEEMRPETEVASLLVRMDDQTLEDALRRARDRAAAYDATLTPLNQTIDLLEKHLAPQAATDASGSNAARSMGRDFIAARLRYTAQRYDAEARLNQSVANLYELEVRTSNIEAERHHARSQKFFYGMLAAQLAVIVATFAIAARKRNFLWSLAAAAGAGAVGFAVYVYLYV